MSDQNDLSMVDVSNAIDNISNGSNQNDNPGPTRRKSTMILTEEHEHDMDRDGENTVHDENDTEQMHVDESPASAENQSSSSSDQHPMTPVDLLTQAPSSEQVSSSHQESVPQSAPAPPPPQEAGEPDPSITVPVDIKWVQGGEKVYVTGSFTGWRKMIGLQKQPDSTHLVTLGLPVGTHRLRFVIDNELRFSDFLPTATDHMGNFVNYVEVTPEHVRLHLQQQRELEMEQEELQKEEEELKRSAPSRRGSVSSGRSRSNSVFGLTNDDDDMGNGYLRYHDDENDAGLQRRRLKYINEIPPIFVDPKVMEQYYMAIDEQAKAKNGQQQAWLHPPHLPPHLDNVILNNFNLQDRDNNSGALPIPNHVVLNHLATTSIKHNTLAVASIVRYKRKYVTQVLYAPLQQ